MTTGVSKLDIVDKFFYSESLPFTTVKSSYSAMLDTSC